MENQQETSQNQHTNDIFAQLSDSQWRFITAMVENPSWSKKEAAEYIEITPSTVYRWPEYVDEALALARRDIHNAAITMRRQMLLKAMAVKLKLLDSADESIRSKAASEIIEWELGKATQTTDITSDGKPLTIGIVGMDMDDL